mgnify:CR=1 FL=1
MPADGCRVEGAFEIGGDFFGQGFFAAGVDVERGVANFRPSVDGEVALGNDHDAAEADGVVGVNEAVDHGGPGVGGAGDHGCPKRLMIGE